jgi:hypothetical protein
MAMTGDVRDMLARLKLVLPARWFADTTPVLDAVLSAFAAGWSGMYDLLQSVRLQSRLATASGIFLDMAAADYLGSDLPRRAGEADSSYSARIRANLLEPRATRAGVAQALLNLTGRAPIIFEPLNATDTGGYNSFTLGYGLAGGYGCASLPYQFFVTAFRPNATPVSHAGGYNAGPGGFGMAPMFYAQAAGLGGAATDAEIRGAIAAVLPTTAIAWTKISN